MKYPVLLALLASPLLAKELPLKVVQNTAREIDSLLADGQKKHEVKATKITDEPTFLRRTYLNIAGRIPTPQETKNFLSSTSENKRTELIENLVGGPGQKSKLFNFYADLLRLQTNSESHGLGWHVWIRDAVNENMPYDKMIHAMLSADGHAANNPAVGYYLRDRGMLLDNVSNTVQVFLGHQIGCAQCHDHPFDKYTQMDYYQLASFLGSTNYQSLETRQKIAQTVGINPEAMRKRIKERQGRKQKITPAERKQMQKKKEEARDIASFFRYHNRNALHDAPGKTLKLPEDYAYEDGEPGETVSPRTLFGKKYENVPVGERREAFAEWVTSRDNPFFSKVIANRLWNEVFGYGLVPTLDDWSNAPETAYPEVMEALDKAMKICDYDVQQFLRILYHTTLFQREASPTEPSPGFSFEFAGPVLRRMSAEEIHDSFLVIARGDIDTMTNDSLKDSWDSYAKSFKFLMSADKEQIMKFDDAFDKNEKSRIENQRKIATLGKQAREARNSGDMQKARKLYADVQKLKSQFKKNYSPRGGDPDLKMAAPASMRRIRGTKNNPFLRASEQPTPFRGGTLVQEFGGSDRQSPDAAHTEASVPQALRLLNGKETAMLLMRRGGFDRKVKKQDNPEEILNFLFLSIYNTYPTEKEKEQFLPLVQDQESLHSLAQAMITSNRFLFVQ